jgi:diacylglycerol kinase
MMVFKTFFRSLKHASHGLRDVAREEASFRLQIMISLVVIGLAILLKLATWEFILIVLLCGAIMVLEVINSVMERFVDALQPRLSLMVRQVKDMMAGAVLLTALTAAVVGFVIFYPHFYALLCAILDICEQRLGGF